ncbi:MAG: DUF4365 domain-containing protein [Reichenbachiella sp.]|uniref:DUF4365 domain-containing protein n=1 Tax=Reichenbachiella sp. TaxID=2184521 RepID=UPI0032638228
MSLFDPIERIGIHRSALIFLEQFGWIEREQPISDFGIDMHVEIVDNGVPTGQIFAIQIKSGSSYFKEETPTGYTYRGKNRHLEYWMSQSLPVLILIYEPNFNSVFWQLVDATNIVKTEEAWKMEIPKKQLLEKSKSELRRIYHNPNHYIIMHVGDNSHAGARRVEVKILVESTHAQSRNAMKKMIPKVIKKYKKSDYHRNEITKQQYEEKDADVVFVFFYDSIQHVDRGLTFCRAIWNNSECEFKLHPFTADEKLDEIEIKWDMEFSAISNLINDNEFSKGEYLEKADKVFNNIKTLFIESGESFDKYEKSGNYIDLLKFIGSKRTQFEQLTSSPLEEGFPPLECQELDNVIREAEALIHNIWIVSNDKNRDESNITYLIKYYLGLASPKIAHYDYELQKIK